MSSGLGSERSTDVVVNDRVWHPWVRLRRVIRDVLAMSWDSGQWPVATVAAMTERSKIARSGWFS